MRRYLIVLTLLLSAFSIAPAAFGAEVEYFDILQKDELSNSELHTSKSLLTPEPALTIPLPGERKSAKLFELTDRRATQIVPILDAKGEKVGEESSTVQYLTDYKGIYGVMTKSPLGTEAVLSDQSTSLPQLYEVHPVNGSSGIRHSVTKVTAEDLLAKINCGAEAPPVPHLAKLSTVDPQIQALGSDFPLREIQLVVVSSTEFTRQFTGTEDEVKKAVVARVRSVVAGAELFFEVLRLKIRVVGVQIFSNANTDPYRSGIKDQDANEMLFALKANWEDRTTPEHDLVAVFATGVYDKTFGLAYTGSSCELPEYSFLFASQGGTSAAMQAGMSSTLAHEMGHFVGMSHDDHQYKGTQICTKEEIDRKECQPSLMWPTVVKETIYFSQISVDEYLNHAAPGLPGGECFGEPRNTGSNNGGSTIATTNLQFSDGDFDSVKIREGSQTILSTSVFEDDETVSYSTGALPSWVTFDAAARKLVVAPNFDVVKRGKKSKTVIVTINATRGNEKASKQFSILVLDKNRAARVDTKTLLQAISANEYNASKAVVTKLSFAAVDPDGDKAVLVLTNAKELRALGLRSKYSSNKRQLVLSGKLSAKAQGRVHLKFRTKDARGAEKSIRLTLNIVD